MRPNGSIVPTPSRYNGAPQYRKVASSCRTWDGCCCRWSRTPVAHDLLVGGSTPASTLAAYGATSRNTHENFLSAAAKIGLGLRDIPPCVTFFAPVSLDPKGRFLWNSGRKRSGDFVELRAEMNLVLVLSNCAHPLDPARPAASGPITLVRH